MPSIAELPSWRDLLAEAQSRQYSDDLLAQLRERYFGQLQESDEWDRIGFERQTLFGEDIFGQDEWARRQFSTLRSPEFQQMPLPDRHEVFNALAGTVSAFKNLPPELKSKLRESLIMAPGVSDVESIPAQSIIEEPTEGGLFSPVEELWRGVQRGIPQAAGSLVETAGVLGDVLGADDFSGDAYKLADLIAIGGEGEQPERRVGRIEDIKNPGDFINWAAGALGEQIPILGSVVGAGLLGTAIGGPAGAAAGAGIAGGALETGSISQDIRAESGEASPFTALGFGTAAGSLEALPIAKLLTKNPWVKRKFTHFLKNAAKQALKTGLQEAGTEFGQTFVERAGVDFALQNRGLLEKVKLTTKEGAKETLWDALNAAAAGAVTGGALGGISSPAGITRGEGDQKVKTPPERPESLFTVPQEEAEQKPQEEKRTDWTYDEEVEARLQYAPRWLTEEGLAEQWAAGEITNEQILESDLEIDRSIAEQDLKDSERQAVYKLQTGKELLEPGRGVPEDEGVPDTERGQPKEGEESGPEVVREEEAKESQESELDTTITGEIEVDPVEKVVSGELDSHVVTGQDLLPIQMADVKKKIKKIHGLYVEPMPPVEVETDVGTTVPSHPGYVIAKTPEAAKAKLEEILGGKDALQVEEKEAQEAEEVKIGAEPVGEWGQSPLNEDAVAWAFPGAREVKPAKYGAVIRFKNAPEVRVVAVNSIPEDPRAIAAHGYTMEEYRKLKEFGGVQVRGMHGAVNGHQIIRVAKQFADVETIDHEAFHFVMANALTRKEQATLLRQYKSEEKAAEAYANWSPKDGGIFQKIMEWAKRLAEGLGLKNLSGETVFRRIRSGEVLSRKSREVAKGQKAALQLNVTKMTETQKNALKSAQEQAAKEADAESFPDAASRGRFEQMRVIRHLQKQGIDIPKMQAEHLQLKTPSLEVNRAGAPAAVIPKETLRGWIARKLVTKNKPLETLGEVYEAVRMEDIPEELDAYLSAESAHPRAYNKQKTFLRRKFEPLIKRIGKATDGNIKEFEDYLEAIHMFEANDHLREIWVRRPRKRVQEKLDELEGRAAETRKLNSERGQTPGRMKTLANLDRRIDEAKAELEEIESREPTGGLTNEEAESILKALKKKGAISYNEKEDPLTRTYSGKYAELGKEIHQITEDMLDLREAYGLIAPADVDAIRAKYKRYVPLKGTVPDVITRLRGSDLPPIYGLEQKTASGFRGGEGRRGAGKFKRRVGRTERAQNPILAQIATDMSELLIQGENNEVAQHVLRLANEFRELKLADGTPVFEIDPVKWKKVVKEDIGEARIVRDSLQEKMAENALRVKYKGKDYYLHINDERLASAIINMNRVKAGAVVRAVAPVSRFLSQVHTTWNPEFVITNFFRDVASAGIHLSREETSKLRKKVFKNVLKAIPAIYKAEGGKIEGKLGERYEQYKELGGKIEFGMLPDVERMARKLQKTAREGARDSKQIFAYLKSVGRFMEDINVAVENAARLAAFDAAIDSGISPKKAAALGRRLTVDFSRSGEWGSAINSLYIFANASLQGTALVGRQLFGKTRSPAVTKILAGMGVMGAMWAVAGRMLAGDDEDGNSYWDQIPSYVKERNIVIPYGSDGNFFKIPLPYGFNIPWVMGTSMTDVAMGGVEVGQGTADVLSAIAGSFNPLGDTDLSTLQGWVQMGTPSAARVPVDVALNKNFFSAPIMPEPRMSKVKQYGGKPNDSERYFTTVSAPSKYLAQLLNKITGGDAIKPGMISISPETLDYAIEGYTGGTGRTMRNIGSLLWKGAKGERPAVNEIPGLRRFLGEQNEYYIPQTYRANMAMVFELEDRLEYLKKEQGPEQARLFGERNRNLLRLIPKAKQAEKDYKIAKKQGNEKRAEQVMRLFNKAVRLAEERG